MQCEFCSKYLTDRDVAHGIKYGAVDGVTSLFIPARDSAYTVVCSSCGELLYKLIYSKLKQAA